MKVSNKNKQDLIIKDCITSDVVEIWNLVVPNAFIKISYDESRVFESASLKIGRVFSNDCLSFEWIQSS